MKNVKLSDRLQHLLIQIPDKSRLADIGSDHALLPIAAVESGKAVFAVAGEVNPGPFDAACKGVAEAGLRKVISVRRGDGLDVLEPGEVNCITIAGMGGALIASILDRGLNKGKLKDVTTLVLQPNVGEDILRRWLLDHNWVLVAESILEEDGKQYEVMTAVPEDRSAGISNDNVYREYKIGDSAFVCSQDILLQMGPWLLQAPNEVFFAKWQGEIQKLEGILTSLSRSELESAEHKRKQIEAQIKEITEVLQCLPRDKQ